MASSDNDDIEIMIIEDNQEDAELTMRALKKHHLANKIVHLVDGAEALDFIYGQGDFAGRNINQVPKVILVDLKMPKVSGLEVLKAIKSDPRIKMIPVVILTSSAEDPDIKEAYELGANSYIVKPVDFNVFFKTVAELGLYWLVVNKV